MKEPANETQPASVAAATPSKQAGEAAPHREEGGVERRVWTERMLTRLTTGGSADRVWFSLMDKTDSSANLHRAYEKVWRNGGSAGADGQTVAPFARQAGAELQRLHETLREGSYSPQPAGRAWIDKPGSRERRPLGIPAVRDRIVQGALRHVLEPIFEADFAGQSYGFRPGREPEPAGRARIFPAQQGQHVGRGGRVCAATAAESAAMAAGRARGWTGGGAPPLAQ